MLKAVMKKPKKSRRSKAFLKSINKAKFTFFWETDTLYISKIEWRVVSDEWFVLKPCYWSAKKIIAIIMRSYLGK